MNFKNIQKFIFLMRLHRPIGIYLLLWPTLIALWMASTHYPDPFILSVFILGVIVMRSAGCVVNDLLDRKFDPFVSRTQDRPMATGAVSPKEAIILLGILLSIALFLVSRLNYLTIEISAIALLLTLIYPLMKRYTHWAQVVLGAAFGIAVPMAFAAISNSIPNTAWILYLAILLWTVAFDTEYAMKDRAEDFNLGLKSTAILFGKYDRFIIAALQFGTLALFLKLGLDLSYGFIYFGGLLLAISFIVYQQYLIKNRDPDQCFKAFLNNHYLGAWLFVVLLIDKGVRHL